MTDDTWAAVARHKTRERRERVRHVWEQHGTVPVLLQDLFPQEWERIRTCRLNFRVFRSKEDRSKAKVTPISCNRIPFCIPCTKAQRFRQVQRAFDKFSRATPKGKPKRFVHIVMTAPLTEDGEGWGLAASKDVPRFAGVIRRSLEEMYAPGIGGVMSYQDFGERHFKKRHPHMDLSLNGWILTENSAAPLPELDLRGRGRQRVDDITKKFAQTFQLGAHASNVKVQRMVEGIRSYYRVLKYQMREMVDFSNLSYNRAEGTVDWSSYKGPGTRYTAGEFLEGFTEYKARLRQYIPKHQGHLELHRYFGSMAKRSLGRTQKIFGGEPLEHGDDCPCHRCQDWERVYDKDVGQHATWALDDLPMGDWVSHIPAEG